MNNITPEVFSRIYKGVYLYLNGKHDYPKYGWKGVKAPPVNFNWAPKFIRSEDDATIAAVGSVLNGKYWFDLDEESCYNIFITWKSMINNPSLSVAELGCSSTADLKFLLKEPSSASPAPLLSMMIGGKIHFVTFYFIVSMCGVKHWNSLVWKIHREKLERAMEVFTIGKPAMVEFARLTRQAIEKTHIIV